MQCWLFVVAVHRSGIRMDLIQHGMVCVPDLCKIYPTQSFYDEVKIELQPRSMTEKVLCIFLPAHFVVSQSPSVVTHEPITSM